MAAVSIDMTKVAATGLTTFATDTAGNVKPVGAASVEGAFAQANATDNVLNFIDDAKDGATITNLKKGWTITAGDVTGGIWLTSSSNKITTGSGDDSISLGGASVTATTGDGDDTINGSEGYANLSVGDGDNKVSVEGNHVTVTAGYGANQVTINGGYAKVTLGGGNDSVSVVGNNANISAGQGDDSILVNGASATVAAGEGDDYVSLNGAHAYVDLGRGNDSLINSVASYSTVKSDDGENRISLSGTDISVETGRDADKISIMGNNATVDAGDGDNIISVAGTHASVKTGRGDDSISVNQAYATIASGAGADTIYALAHDASVSSGDGDDQISATGANAYIDAGAGNDTISVSGKYATVSAGAGNDSLVLTAATGASVAAGDGNNFVSIDGSYATVTAGTGNDTISIAGEGNNYVDAGAGRNTISLNGNNNTVKAGAGSDTITVAGSYANVSIGDGNDSVSISGAYATVTAGAGNDTISVGNNASITENAGNNDIHAGNDATVTAGAGSDTIVVGNNSSVTAGDGDNNITAGTYATVTSSAGKDTVTAGANSTVTTGDGTDSIVVASGADDVTITAGAGKDTVVAGGKGTIFTDYEFDVDRISIAGANSMSAANFGTDGKISTANADITVSTVAGGYYAAQLTEGTKHTNYAWTGTDSATLNGTAMKEAVYEIGTKNDNEGDLLWGSKYNDTIIAGSNESIVGDRGNDSISITSGATGVYIGINSGDGNDTATGATLGYDDEDTTIYLNSIEKLGTSLTTAGTDVKVTLKGASLTLTNAKTSGTANAKVKLQYAGETYKAQIFDTGATLDDDTTLVYGVGTTNTLSVTSSEDYTIDLGNQKRYDDTRLYSGVQVVDASTSTGDNVLIGGEKSSTLKAGTGATTLWGGSSKADSLVGGTGEDLFVYGYGEDGRDTISGYDSSEDKIFFVNADKFKSVKRTSTGVTFTFTSDSASSQKLTVAETAATQSADDKYVWTTDGTNTEVAKIGLTDSVNAFTYDEEVKYYAGGKKGDTLKVTGSDDANVWLDNSGQGGAYYNGITTVDASTTNGDVTLAGSAANEKLYASLGDSSLFGGAGNDLLVANANGGTTTFFFGKGCGKDTISGSDADDRIMLYDVALSDINGDKSSVGSDLKIALNDGSALTVSSVASGTTFTLGDGTSWTYENGSFEQA